MSSWVPRLYDDVDYIRRDSAQQIHDVLVVCMKPLKRTAIMRKANLQFNSLAPMTEKLMTAGFLVVESALRPDKRSWEVFRTTPTGKAWLLKAEELYSPFVSLEG